VNTIRPYLGYQDFNTRASDFSSNYNSLQVSLNRHVSKGLTFGVAYTWSKNLTNNLSDRSNAIYDTYNYRLNYGPASLNTPQVFVANYVYDLPFFKAQQGLVGRLLGGWEVSGVTTVESGQSISVRQSNDPFNSGDFAAAPGTYPGGIGIDPSPIAPRPDRVLGASLSGAGNVTQWFNTNAFATAVGHFGTAAPGVLLGPGTQNWDIAAIKNIKIAERFSIQFRGEFFNAFNHVNFTSSGVVTNRNSPTFGRLTAAHNPRNIQLGLKLYF
jgi:hypothetical protein